MLPPWPPHQVHTLAVEHLMGQLPETLTGIRTDLLRLLSLTDALRSLQLNDAVFPLLNTVSAAHDEAAACLLRIADQVCGPEAAVIRMRAEARTVSERKRAALAQVETREQELVLLYGPMATWPYKSPEHFISAIVSLVDHEAMQLIDTADRMIGALLTHLAQRLARQDLSHGAVPTFVLTNLIGAAGEASSVPAHFAYFLPEDEGAPAFGRRKVVVYRNLYAQRFERVTRRLAERFLVPFALPRPSRCPDLLCLWFRGHDIGHSLHTRTRLCDALAALDRASISCLEEALSDAIGYLAITEGPWQARFDLPPVTSTGLFLSELLRYGVRGSNAFSDSDAARLALAWLVERGAVQLHSEPPQLQWSCERVHGAMLELTSELVIALLDENLERARSLLALLDADHDSARWWTVVTAQARDIPNLMVLTFSLSSDSASSPWNNK
jgi:hypothetical protein